MLTFEHTMFSSDWLKIVSSNQKHYPVLDSDTSSVWNFYARFSDVISRETNGDVAKCRQFSQAKFYKEMSENDWPLDKLVLPIEQKKKLSFESSS